MEIDVLRRESREIGWRGRGGRGALYVVCSGLADRGGFDTPLGLRRVGGVAEADGGLDGRVGARSGAILVLAGRVLWRSWQDGVEHKGRAARIKRWW